MTPARPAATAARMYDYFLGGIHNFPADQEAAQAVIAQIPDIRLMAWANRDFLTRAVRWLVAQGVHQFLDIGSGIPAEGNVHDIAQRAAPQARVVYVDVDSDAVVAGSYLVLSHLTPESRPRDIDTLARLLATAGIPVVARRRAQIRRLLSGYALLDPGLVWAPQWRPDPDEPVDETSPAPSDSCLLAAVAQAKSFYWPTGWPWAKRLAHWTHIMRF